MKKYFDLVKENPLFAKIAYSDFNGMLACLLAKEKSYDKNEIILLAGAPINSVGIVLTGSVKIRKEDPNGNETILAEVLRGEMFGEVFACAGIFYSPVSIVTTTKSEILFLNYRKVITTCKKSCVFHQMLTENMLKIIANKNLYLNQKIDILSKRTLRGKIVTYLTYVSKGATTVTISLNREELAQYLCADRSALSNELSKMQKDGIIRYVKNTFELIEIGDQNYEKEKKN